MLDFAIFAVTFVVFLIGAVLYLYPSSRRASGVPGFNPTEEKDGNLQDIINRGSLHEFLVGLHDQFGPVASFWFGRRLVVSLGAVEQLQQHVNPNRTNSFETMLKSLLGYNSGAGVGGVEALMSKKVYEEAINTTLDGNFPLLLKIVEELVGKWQSSPKKQHIPVCAHVLGLSLKIVTQLAMGTKFASKSEVMDFRKNHATVWSEIGKGFLDGSMEKSASRRAQYESALAEMESMLKSAITDRNEDHSKPSVFIDCLLKANLSERKVMEESMVFTLAGCVITAGLCVWAVHFVSTSQTVQEKLYKEFTEVLGDEPITLEKIPKLKYCQQVLNETVRTAKLTPVAASLQEVEGKVDQHIIPKETLVIYALGVILQDSDTWALPYSFDPDRFTDESIKKSFSLLGFSGSQTCPELRFAYTVATVLLSILVQRLQVNQVEGQVVEAVYELVTTPKDENWVTASKRSKGTFLQNVLPKTSST